MGMFSKIIQPRCEYCRHSCTLKDSSSVICARIGDIGDSSNCKSFKYDPLKRIPAKKRRIVAFTEKDFSIDTSEKKYERTVVRPDSGNTGKKPASASANKDESNSDNNAATANNKPYAPANDSSSGINLGMDDIKNFPVDEMLNDFYGQVSAIDNPNENAGTPNEESYANQNGADAPSYENTSLDSETPHIQFYRNTDENNANSDAPGEGAMVFEDLWSSDDTQSNTDKEASVDESNVTEQPSSYQESQAGDSLTDEQTVYAKSKEPDTAPSEHKAEKEPANKKLTEREQAEIARKEKIDALLSSYYARKNAEKELLEKENMTPEQAILARREKFEKIRSAYNARKNAEKEPVKESVPAEQPMIVKAEKPMAMPPSDYEDYAVKSINEPAKENTPAEQSAPVNAEKPMAMPPSNYARNTVGRELNNRESFLKRPIASVNKKTEGTVFSADFDDEYQPMRNYSDNEVDINALPSFDSLLNR